MLKTEQRELQFIRNCKLVDEVGKNMLSGLVSHDIVCVKLKESLKIRAHKRNNNEIPLQCSDDIIELTCCGLCSHSTSTKLNFRPFSNPSSLLSKYIETTNMLKSISTSILFSLYFCSLSFFPVSRPGKIKFGHTQAVQE
jgi:hypothetical protein